MNDYTAMAIMQRLDDMEAATQRIAANSARPMSWLVVLPIAVAVNLYAVPYLKNNNVPYLSDGLTMALEYEKGLAIDLGVFTADKISGEQRHLPRQTSKHTILGLSRAETTALMHNIAKTESGHKYNVVNRFGYAGKWQFGASALTQVGLIKRSEYKKAGRGVRIGRSGHKVFLNKAENWTIKGGLKTFLASARIQDKAFIHLTNFNIQQGYRLRVLSKKSSAARIAGFAKAAHLKGVGAAKRWYKYKIDSKDGNGTRVSVYAAQAEKAVKNATINNSEIDDSWM